MKRLGRTLKENFTIFKIFFFNDLFITILQRFPEVAVRRTHTQEEKIEKKVPWYGAHIQGGLEKLKSPVSGFEIALRKAVKKRSFSSTPYIE